MFLEDMPKKEKELNKDLKTKIQGNKQYNIFISNIKFQKLRLKDNSKNIMKRNTYNPQTLIFLPIISYI